MVQPLASAVLIGVANPASLAVGLLACPLIAAVVLGRASRERGPARWPSVDTVMARRPLTLGTDATIDEAEGLNFSQQLFTSYPVVDQDGYAVGLVALDDIRAVQCDARPNTTVEQVMCSEPDIFVYAGTSVRTLLDSAAFTRRGRAVVVGENGKPVGLISITDVRRRLGARGDRTAGAAGSR